MVNVGSVDRGVRFAVGAILIVLSLLPMAAGWGAWRWVAVAVGLVLIATAAMRTCPAYSLLGMNTRGTGKK